MNERVASLNGRMVPESQAAISDFDRGVLWGDAVYDVARTFNHRPFKLREHIDRLYRSCTYTRMPIHLTPDAMEKHTLDVVEHNVSFLAPAEDEMIWWSVTRGLNPPSRNLVDCREATVIICTFPVPFRGFGKWTTRGVRMVTPSVRRTPAECLDPKAKVSNKMNHILADLEAKGADPEAYSLMLDINGNVAESSGANFFLVRQGQLCTPTRHNILEGITRATTMELAKSLGIPALEGEFTIYDVYTADEAFLTTTTYCILPVAQVNGAAMGSEAPGPLTRKLMDAWSKLVGVDIVAQALSHVEPEPISTKG